VCAALAGVALAAMPASSSAGAFTWTGGAASSFWSVPGNWSPNGVPSGNNDEAFIPNVSNSGPTNVTDNQNIFPAGLAMLRVSRTGLGPYFSILSIAADSLAASEEDVGYGAGVLAGRGEINQSTGTNGVNPFPDTGAVGVLMLAGTSPDVGIYNLSGTGQLILSDNCLAYVGYAGAGSVNQSGGTLTTNFGGAVYVGYNAGSTGHYNQSAGTLSLGPGPIYVGFSTGSSGQYTLNGNGTITSAIYPGDFEGAVIVGFAGAGTFDQSAGLATLSALTLGYLSGGSGTYLLSGIGALNAFNEVIGYNGSGVFNQSGGTNTCAGEVLGRSSGSGMYNLSGGVLSAGSISINATGTINFTGGTLATGALALNGGGKMFMGSGDKLLIKTNSLSIDAAGGSKLDLCDNATIVDYSGASPIATIDGYIKSGYASGSWTGNGITSSSAAVDSTKALGYADNSALGLSNFMGQSVDSTSILIRFTYFGDANLDGTVDTIDFNLMAANFSQGGKDWFHGDFNYDNIVDTIDFNLLASNFGLTLPAAMPSTLVPEPTGSMACAAAPLAIALRRPRRRC